MEKSAKREMTRERDVTRDDTRIPEREKKINPTGAYSIVGGRMDEDRYVARLKLIRDIARRMGRVNYKQIANILRVSPNTASQLCGSAAYYFSEELVYNRGWLTYIGEEREETRDDTRRPEMTITREEGREEERAREILEAKPVEEDIVEVERV